MKTIWKYVIWPDDCSQLIPAGAELLSVHGQKEDICVWALVDTKANKEKRKFKVIPTGGMVPDGVPLLFLGTVHLRQGELVFHVFEILE